MSKGLFIVGTDTDVGKTFVTGLIMKSLRDKGVNVGYYKAVLSGGYYDGDELIPGDAKEVLETSGIDENYDQCVSYILENAVSPHLAARWEGVDICLEKVLSDYKTLTSKYDYLTVEGSGGIICPIKITDKEVILLEDIIKMLELPVMLVARAGLGTINHTALTVKYLHHQGIQIKGIILNEFEKGNKMHEDNQEVIKRLTEVPILATIPKVRQGEKIEIEFKEILNLYQ